MLEYAKSDNLFLDYYYYHHYYYYYYYLWLCWLELTLSLSVVFWVFWWYSDLGITYHTIHNPHAGQFWELFFLVCFSTDDHEVPLYERLSLVSFECILQLILSMTCYSLYCLCLFFFFLFTLCFPVNLVQWV